MRSTRMFISIITAGCLSVALSMAGHAAEIGVIVDYSPPGATLLLERTGVKQPIRIATLVQAGDKIELPASGSVTIELADSRRMTSSGPGTWEVPAAPVLGSIATYFHRIALIMEPDYRLSASAITREMKLCNRDPIVMPLLPEGALVKAGQRGLTLNWKGGCPPYRLELISDQGMLGVKSGLTAPEVRFDKLALHPGVYSVSITDKSGTHVSTPFAVRMDAPAWPVGLVDDKSHLGTVARALWLADVDQGIWRVDSGELLFPLRSQHDTLAEAAWEHIQAHAAANPP